MTMVLAVLVAGGFYYLERPTDTGPQPYRTTMTLEVPSAVPEEGEDPADVQDVPDVVFREQLALANDPATKEAALAAAPPGDATATFSASLDDDRVRLVVTSLDQTVSQEVASAYSTAYIDARRSLVASDIDNQQRGLLERVESLRTRLRTVESDLTAQFGPLPACVSTGEDEDGEGGGSVPLISSGPAASLDGILLQYERCALYDRVEEAQLELASLRTQAETPSAFATVIGQNTSRDQAEETASLLGPIGGILVAGLVLGLAGAVLRDRMDHTIRHAERAARALSAPLLSKIPARRRRNEATVLLHPGSSRTEAFRDLAATCVATDRLPRAIMVTTPRGDVHEDVAANFAAALADLGVRVALVATSPRQSWFLSPFADDGSELTTLPQMLDEAHAGRLNGQVQRRLARTDLTPNLVVLPPGDNPDLGLALDGLPPLLQAMTDSDIDVTVIAGPALLDESSATIVAWATRTVLWAIQAGEVTEQEASTGAARLELAGVRAFGVAVVGAES